VRLQQSKSDKQSNLLSLLYFIKHLVDVSKKPPQKHDEN
jgi:hypothetical protein